MSAIDNILNEIEYAALHPGRMLQEWKNATGGKAVGCLPIHCPEEIIHAAGMLPVGLWGGQASVQKASEYLQAFCCSIMKAIMEFALNGVYRNLDAIVSPNTCDTMRCIPLMIDLAVAHPPVIGLVLPDNRKLECGIQFTAAEYGKLGDELIKVGGKPITREALDQSIEIYNQHRRTMMEFFRTASEHCDIITPYYRHMVVKSSFFVPKEKHTKWVQVLNAEMNQLPPAEWDGQRVVLTGIMPEPYELLKMMEEFKIAVVADDLAMGSRQFRTLVPKGEDPFVRLGQSFADFEGCSCVADAAKLRGKMLADMCQEYRADGVIVLMMKFCDPEEYDYPFIKQDLEEAGITHVYIESEQQMESLEQARTRLQAFKEIVGAK